MLKKNKLKSRRWKKNEDEIFEIFFYQLNLLLLRQYVKDDECSQSFNFLSRAIQNAPLTLQNGQLRTSIFHKSAAESCILPYTSDHPRYIHRNIPYVALLRTPHICSHVNDFNLEGIRIDVSLLLNSYPPKFITQQFNRFFSFKPRSMLPASGNGWNPLERAGKAIGSYRKTSEK